jgi:predicted dehydrogenase
MTPEIRNIRCGIVGFGFIGPQHAEAMRRLGFVEVAAVCSDQPDTLRRKAAQLRIPKVYARYEDLLADPAIDVVDVVTPTHLHHTVALAALRAGKHVIVDKPLALSSRQARELADTARERALVNAVTFNYRYHPLVQQARILVRGGEIGPIHLIHGHYMQEWLLYDTDFSWRLDPAFSGPAAMVADAGSHWFDLVEHVTGLRVDSVSAELKTTIKVRKKPVGAAREAFAAAGEERTEPFEVTVPDLGIAMLRMENGASGTFLTSPLCAGHKNDLQFEIHGSRASLRWLQEEPNRLWIGRRDEPDQVMVKDPSLLDPSVRRYASLPGGHNEAWPDAFRNVLRNVFEFIASGADPRAPGGIPFPTFEDGYRAAAIAEALVSSAAAAGQWTKVAPGAE